MDKDVIKRVKFSPDVYKELKKLAIELDMDKDGAIRSEELGQVIEYLVLNKQENQGDSTLLIKQLKELVYSKSNSSVENESQNKSSLE